MPTTFRRGRRPRHRRQRRPGPIPAGRALVRHSRPRERLATGWRPASTSGRCRSPSSCSGWRRPRRRWVMCRRSAEAYCGGTQCEP